MTNELDGHDGLDTEQSTPVLMRRNVTVVDETNYDADTEF